MAEGCHVAVPTGRPPWRDRETCQRDLRRSEFASGSRGVSFTLAHQRSSEGGAEQVLKGSSNESAAAERGASASAKFRPLMAMAATQHPTDMNSSPCPTPSCR